MDYHHHLNSISIGHCLRQAKQLWWSNKWLMLFLCIFFYALPEATAPMAIDGVFGSSLVAMTADGVGRDAAYFVDDLIGYLTDAFIALVIITQLVHKKITLSGLLWILIKASIFIFLFACLDNSLGYIPGLLRFPVWIGFAALFYLTVPVLVCERKNTFGAMRRSYELTTGKRLQFLFLGSLYYGSFLAVNILQVLLEDGPMYSSLQLAYIDPAYEMVRALMLSYFAIVYAVAYFELQPYKDQIDDDRSIEAFD